MECVLIRSFPKVEKPPPSSLPFPVAAELSNSFSTAQVSRIQPCKSLGNNSAMRFWRQLSVHKLVESSGEKFAFNRRRNTTKYGRVMNAASEHPLESTDNGAHRHRFSWKSVRDALNAFYRFSRPHTVIGTVLSITSISLVAVERLSDISPLFCTGVLEAIVVALLINTYVVGLNQLSDIDIDKVNKPFLPLASGEYSFTTGVLIVSSSAIMSFWLGWIIGSWPLFWAIFLWFALGTAYSLNIPFLRWKRFPSIAAMCIFAVRAIIVPISFYLHIQTHVFGRWVVLPKPVIFATGFMSFFSVAIALFKDIPDIVGDKAHGIQSFTVKMGQKRMFWICIWLLEMAYSVAVLVGASSPSFWSKCITVFAHAIMASLLWNRAKSINLKSKTELTSFYMFIWKLFYVEYLLVPLVR